MSVRHHRTLASSGKLDDGLEFSEKSANGVERKEKVKEKTGNCDGLALVSQTHRIDVSAQMEAGGGSVRTSTSSLHQSV